MRTISMVLFCGLFIALLAASAEARDENATVTSPRGIQIDEFGASAMVLDPTLTTNLNAMKDWDKHNSARKPSPVRISGEIRLREENWGNFYGPDNSASGGTDFSGGDESFDFTLLRTRLRFDVDIEEDLVAVIEFQDVRVLGSEGSTVADTEGVDLKRGAFIVRNMFNQPLSLEVGRFVLKYGDERILGGLDWSNPGRAYDGFRFSLAPKGWYVDFFGVRINDLAFDDDDDRDLLGVYTGTHRVPELGYEGYALLYRDQRRMAGTALNQTEDRFYTFGWRLFGEAAGFDYSGEMATQSGEVDDETLAAYAAAAKGGYTIDCPGKPRIGVEVDFASGDSRPTDSNNKQFQHMFPTNHKHYGYADLVGWSNMWDYRGSVSMKPSEQTKVALDWHHLRLDDTDGGWINSAGQTIRAGNHDAGSHLGDELDVTFTWNASQSLAVLTGYSHFFPGSFVDDTQTGHGDSLDFVYVQGRVRF